MIKAIQRYFKKRSIKKMTDEMVKDGNYLDLSGCITEDQKKEFTEDVMKTAGKVMMLAFYTAGLKDFMCCTLVNEANGDTFEFSLKKVKPELPINL